MPRFFYQESAMTSASPQQCVEAAYKVLGAKGGKPVVMGARVIGKLGSWLMTRIIGGAFVPLDWLPTDIVIDVIEGPGGRQVTVSVAEGMGFAITLLGMETRMKQQCYNIAVGLRNAIAQQLPAA
ncbi:MAG: hypothetical protein ABSE70_00835 [Candidatus Limnocylindrales bacterium]